MNLAPIPAASVSTVAAPKPEWADDVYLDIKGSDSNHGWPTVYFRHERQVLARPANITEVPEWTSLEQALAGAGELSRQRKGAPVAILRPDQPGGAFAAAELIVQRDDALRFTKDQDASGWQSIDPSGIEQATGESLDLHHGLRWDDGSEVTRMWNSGVNGEGRVAGVVTFEENWITGRDRLDVDLVPIQLPQRP